MTRLKTSLLVAGLVAGSILSAGAVEARTRVVVRVRPPAPRVEMRVRCPGPNHVWIDGHWRWNGRSYEWSSGHWVARPAGRAAWVPGHWTRRHGGWLWIEGHWRR